MTAPPVDLAAVEARPAFRCTDDTGTEAPEPHVHMTAADRDALTKALRIAHEALTALKTEPRLEEMHSGPWLSTCNAPMCRALSDISALVVVR